MAVEVQRRRFSVDEYEQMGRVGILGEDDRVELLDGEIAKMAPIGLRHADCVNRLTRSLVTTFGDEAVVLVQNPIRLSDWSEPQPDLALVRRRAGLYASSHPRPADILLVVEVAGTSLASDRSVKIPLYARGGVSEVWLVDLSEETVTVYRDPRRAGYRSTHEVRRGDDLAPAAFPDRALNVADLLPE
jgi:Uma2 family endonuclease